MKDYAVFDLATGAIRYSTGNSDDYADGKDNVVECAFSSLTHYIDVATRTPVAFGPPPSFHHRFDYATKQWVDPRTLADFKAAQWEAIKLARTQAEYAGFTWDGSTFDSDATSQNRITGAVTLAQMSAAFTIDWTLKDNTTRTLDQAGMLQVGAALGMHVAAQFSRAQGLRAAIEAATTRADVEAVVW